VISTLVRITPLEAGAPSDEDLARVERLARAAFGRRRKTLLNALRGVPPAPRAPAELRRVLAELGIDPRARVETLAPERILALACALR
jgi:16S rRNA A1518/A1519 N6-dimethyltransferase RsmA/KsgA/DIM1 with predicted DNA glycosylase/AP lyase activity